ncbi:MAG: flagellar basal body P-ring protein FlgI [Phycisphaerae bacterium]|nr:flagellar basal body P-ring protein FlgI [Phycisphaerae bacterium]
MDTLRLRTAALIAVAIAVPAEATRIGDVTHLKGRRDNKLQGLGLVIGLPGTGDGGKYAPSIQALASMLQKFANPVAPELLKDTKNVAIVAVEVVLPENGVREGDRVDAQVSAIGAAKSLSGGRLLLAPLQGPDLGAVFAFASGPVVVGDPKAGTTGVVRQGATMEADVTHFYIDDDRVTLVLEDAHASWALAATIAQLVNEELSPPGQVQPIARAIDPKNVEVIIPPAERSSPAAFIAAVETIELLVPPSEARVTINRRKGTVVITGEVEIGPALISYNGMTISTVQPAPVGTPDAPVVTEKTVAVLDPGRRGGARLRDLVDALNALHLPARDLIAIIEDLKRSGKLHAKLIVEE